MNRFIISIILVYVSLVSCSVQRRFNTMVKNHPELVAKVDTVYKTDSIQVPSIQYEKVITMVHDTSTIMVGDTTVFVTNRMVSRYSGKIDIPSGGVIFYKVMGDRLAIRLEIPKRSVPVKTAYIRTTVKVTKNVWTEIPWYISISLVISILFIALLVVKKVLTKSGLTI